MASPVLQRSRSMSIKMTRAGAITTTRDYALKEENMQLHALGMGEAQMKTG